jgi:adenylate cyclase
MHYQGIRECTVIFTDLTNYNKIADRFELPLVTNLLNEYLTRVCQAALDHDCWVDKFLGDGVMIVTNTPRERADFCLAAVKLAVDIQNRTEDLVAEWLRYELPVSTIKSRIGIATGNVYLGNMGHPKINWYTAVGASVNLAWRLLEFGDRTDHCILMCPRSHQLVRDYVEAEAVQTPYKEASIEPGVSYKLKKMLPTAI